MKAKIFKKGNRNSKRSRKLREELLGKIGMKRIQWMERISSGPFPSKRLLNKKEENRINRRGTLRTPRK